MQIEDSTQNPQAYLRSKLEAPVEVQAPSLQNLLGQAIMNNDAEILKFVFSNRDPEVINATIEASEDERIYRPLIEILSARLENFPKETADLLRWLDAVLKKKVAFFKENPDALAPLRNRTDFFNVKENLYGSLLRVKGKLAFVLEQNSRNVNGEQFLSSSFGIAKVLVDEREHLEPEEEEQLMALSKPKRRGGQKSAKKGPQAENDSFDDMFDEKAFDEAALGEEDIHEADAELDAQEEDLMYEQDESEDQNAMAKGLEEDDDDEEEFGFGEFDNQPVEEEEEEQPRHETQNRGSGKHKKHSQNEQHTNGFSKKPKRR